jgi:LTXXQ motif family protein
MSKFLIAGLSALFIASSSLAYAQAPSAMPPRGAPTPQDLAALTDTRIELVKAALQMTPDQQKLWPPVEEAIRGRAAMRQARLAKLAAAANSDKEYTPIEILRARADGLVERGTALKKLVDAWQPLYDSLDARQKVRLRILAVLVVREMRDRVAERLEAADQDEDEE